LKFIGGTTSLDYSEIKTLDRTSAFQVNTKIFNYKNIALLDKNL